MKLITLEMLQMRIQTVRNKLPDGTKTNSTKIYANINGHEIALHTENFMVDDNGTLVFTLPKMEQRI
jgi:hypothetical protein